MANTFVLISSVTVGAGGASSIDFTSIPATYTDLQLVLSSRNSGAVNYSSIGIYFNGNSGTTQYSNKNVIAYNGSTVGSFSGSSGNSIGLDGEGGNLTANTFQNTSIYIPNYTSSSAYKSVSIDNVAEANSSSLNIASLIAGLWSNNSAITQITISPNSNFVQYSTAYLYGIKNS